MERKEKKYIKSLLHPSVYTLPLTKISHTNLLPKYDYSHIQNYSPFLSRVTKDKSIKQTSHQCWKSQHLHPHHHHRRRNHHQPRMPQEEERETPQNHQGELAVQQYGRHGCSPDTTQYRVYQGEYPCVEVEEAEVDGAEGVGGVAVCNWGYLKRNCAKLRFTVAASMAHINEK